MVYLSMLQQPNDREKECRDRLQKAETALKQSKEKNYYKILKVSRTADKKAIFLHCLPAYR